MSRTDPAAPDGGTHPPPDLAQSVDLALRTAGGVIVVLAALVTAALELILSSLRVGGILIGVAVPVAIAANVVLAWFAYNAVGRKWAVALPALAWFAVILTAAGGTTEGDVGLANNWVGVAIVILGPLGFAVAAARMIAASARR